MSSLDIPNPLWKKLPKNAADYRGANVRTASVETI
jgi:hypothetical protein